MVAACGHAPRKSRAADDSYGVGLATPSVVDNAVSPSRESKGVRRTLSSMWQAHDHLQSSATPEHKLEIVVEADAGVRPDPPFNLGDAVGQFDVIECRQQ